MQKKFFTFMLGVALCGASPVFAMDAEELDIRSITPIKSGMNSAQRREAIHSFLKDALKPECEFQTAEIVSEQSRQARGNGNFFRTYTLNDDSEWVMGEGGLNRFLGHLYLKKAIDYYGLKTLCVVETRFACKKPNDDISISIHPNGIDRLKNIPVIESKDFSSLSRYVGDECPRFGEASEELEILRKKIGFTDFTFSVNLRKKDGKIYIIDTEYGSFSNPFEPYVDGSGDLTFTFPR